MISVFYSVAVPEMQLIWSAMQTELLCLSNSSNF